MVRGSVSHDRYGGGDTLKFLIHDKVDKRYLLPPAELSKIIFGRVMTSFDMLQQFYKHSIDQGKP